MKAKSKNRLLFLLSILIATGIFTSASLADTPHWDVNWNYRKQVAITNNVSTTLYDYSMMITLDTADLISQGKMQSDCGDIRIVENGVEISKQHGSIDVVGVNGKVSIDSQHGNLRIVNVDGDVTLHGAHGNAHLENVSGSVDFSRSHSKAEYVNVAGKPTG